MAPGLGVVKSMRSFDESHQHDDGAPDVEHHDAGVGGDENVAQAAKIAIAQADEAVRACNEVVVPELEKLARKARFERVLIPLYAAAYVIITTNSAAEFLAARQVKSHGNVKNIFSSILVGFAKFAHPLVRGRLCKYAAVIGLAYHENVAPVDFAAWLKTHPIEKACVEYRRTMHKLKQTRRDEQIRKILVSPKQEPDKAPLMPATPITWGHVGLKLAVVDFTIDGKGDFHLLGILPHDRDEVMEIVTAAAAKATV